MSDKGRQLRVAVLISGSGRTLQNFIELSRAGQLPIEIVLVISSRPDVAGVERARRAAVPVEVIGRQGLSVEEFSRRVTEAIEAARVDLVLMAGWLCPWLIPPRYENRVMNIHPALLPKYGGKGFYGHHVHEAVLAAGDRESGCTVHFANNEYDAGPIILQRRVPVLPGDTPDTLADRVFQQECIAYPEAIRLFAEGRLKVREGRVEIG
ncbi:MAG TPA: phosphoribosylglycinamide formyltransferase [Phycisphaerae bacterium]|jgi:phosphoribosylglycinamide formyltransferase-1|nr:phosphoribosylglycinamide formyltransferase [Phycisphaerae bacterium]HOB73727.1 phosphoribosylglycinamide formyltransferase [Phycisphaerae bacterium]HOJ53399.1 phosphoribosylglycinamide formyltransferase [Phycisphaerae bacterium]HOL25477.1 phosphoribosylglycinamide formyltransferase [Phycisphaerae bacterium]HPP19846.1 phosphoribosylglycinamide formyltransferase [Phycisphaerae bacterium]